jgi:hypothetical protein
VAKTPGGARCAQANRGRGGAGGDIGEGTGLAHVAGDVRAAVASRCARSRSSKSNPITCSGAASAAVLLVRAHLLVAYCN